LFSSPISDSRFALRHSGSIMQKGWYGWWAPPGGPLPPLPNGEETLIDPGFNNHGSWAVSRENGAYFQAGWTTILGGWSGQHSTPKIVLIPFNDYIEDTGVWNASTTYLDQERLGIQEFGS